MTEPAGKFSSIVDPDLDLVRAAKTGDYDAFEQLVSRHEKELYNLAMRMLRNSADAQEVVQETFLSVVEHLGEFQETAKFRTWLIRIATNHALHVVRRRRTKPVHSLDAGSDKDEPPLPHPDFIAPWKQDPGKLVERNEVRLLLDEAIEELEEKYRMVFVLRDVEGLSTEETAQALGISIANVKVRLLRARLMLREKLTRTLGDESRRITGGHEHPDE